jgi:hypothetical protein
LADLVGQQQLATHSVEFRTWWATHDVRLHCAGTKQLRHPVVGELTRAFDALDLPADPGLTLTAYTAEPGRMGFSHDYGAGPGADRAIDLMRKAFDLGCTFFDTAEGYGAGANEELVGRALKPIRAKRQRPTLRHRARQGCERDLDSTASAPTWTSSPTRDRPTSSASVARARRPPSRKPT